MPIKHLTNNGIRGFVYILTKVENMNTSNFVSFPKLDDYVLIKYDCVKSEWIDYLTRQRAIINMLISSQP